MVNNSTNINKANIVLFFNFRHERFSSNLFCISVSIKQLYLDEIKYIRT